MKEKATKGYGLIFWLFAFLKCARQDLGGRRRYPSPHWTSRGLARALRNLLWQISENRFVEIYFIFCWCLLFCFGFKKHELRRITVAEHVVSRFTFLNAVIKFPLIFKNRCCFPFLSIFLKINSLPCLRDTVKRGWFTYHWSVSSLPVVFHSCFHSVSNLSIFETTSSKDYFPGIGRSPGPCLRWYISTVVFLSHKSNGNASTLVSFRFACENISNGTILEERYRFNLDLLMGEI